MPEGKAHTGFDALQADAALLAPESAVGKSGLLVSLNLPATAVSGSSFSCTSP
jgi:hypothetical protein